MIQTKTVNNLAKRLLDIAISLFLIAVLSPLLGAVACLVLLNSRGPMLYRQKRVGLDGRLFDICKFRTMVMGADSNGPSVTSADDCRITAIGRFLRTWKLDELPQLFNVLCGHMSLVGPRPQVPRFVEHFDPSLRAIVLRVRPGITGPTALRFRYEERMLANKSDRESYYIQHLLPIKLKMDANYVETSSLKADMKILSETVWLFSLAPMKHFVFGEGKKLDAKPDELLDVRAIS